ncbi:DUF4232 domain-containing protein [Oryzihumus leptocrescens]|uniref:Uncharacterized protein DUF4232 n=1 Tax=Oryzihumus leptocrescens TaxID=297536 RepID=A0A542ZEI8_9MICO|nr:DUF4232 domain-containing protein [Oryzihumus leptocrescens]TQL58680.1 uncharacterized protein DUF4232 [Oryzihumus leptocrescens]
MATSASGPDKPCATDQLHVSAEWAPGGHVYGTDPTHRHSAGELDGQVTAVNHGAACVITGPPRIRLLTSGGLPLRVPTVVGAFCRLACGAPAELHLQTGATAVAGLSWEPSYCGPDPGPGVRLGVALRGSIEARVPVRNLGGAARPVYAPSCTSALPPGRLSVERFGLQEKEGGPAPTSPPVALPNTKGHVCEISMLRLGHGPVVSPMTGENAIIFSLTNVGTRPCSLFGYPAVTLLDGHGAAMPFRYTHGQSQYVTHARPASVLLPPAASAYFLVAKYRCDMEVVSHASSVRVSLGSDLATLAGPTSGGVGILAYCLGAPTEPGRAVDLSPIEATPGATLGTP